MTEDNKQPSLEAALGELNKIVEQMEGGDLPLDKALAHFERGIAVVRSCQKSLQEAEQKVKILLAQNSEAPLDDYTRDDNQ